MLKDLKNVIHGIELRMQLQDGDIVVDIGCNDGSMLGMYSNKNVKKVGFDPAPNLQEQAEKNCGYFINDYFHRDLYPTGVSKAKVVTSIAMFYDLPDPNTFVEDVKFILDKKGIWVIQLTDLYSMLQINAIDNVCAEHLEYYKLGDLTDLMYSHGLRIFSVEYNKVNGGSLRVYVCHAGARPIEQSYYDAFSAECYDFDNNIVSIEKLKHNIDKFKKKIQDFLLPYSVDKVYALAASTKANTLLQIMELDNEWISAIGEVNEDKFGLVTAGTNIPIIPEKEVLEANPQVIIVLAWHFVGTFDKVLSNFLDRGGSALYMLPVPHIRTDNGGFNL
jgi:hypothetical protein